MNDRRAMLKALLLPAAAGVGGVVSATASATAEAASTWNSAVVAISGTVEGGPEAVAFSGDATIATRLAQDPDFGKPSLVMSIDLRAVAGVGSVTRKRYVISGPAMVQKRHGESHAVETTFAFFPAGTSGVEGARSGVATFVIGINLPNGSVTAATAKISTPRL